MQFAQNKLESHFRSFVSEILRTWAGFESATSQSQANAFEHSFEPYLLNRMDIWRVIRWEDLYFTFTTTYHHQQAISYQFRNLLCDRIRSRDHVRWREADNCSTRLHEYHSMPCQCLNFADLSQVRMDNYFWIGSRPYYWGFKPYLNGSEIAESNYTVLCNSE